MAACTRCAMEMLPGATTCMGCGLQLGAPLEPTAPIAAPPIDAAFAPPGTPAADNPFRTGPLPTTPPAFQAIPVPPAPGTALPMPTELPPPPPLPPPDAGWGAPAPSPDQQWAQPAAQPWAGQPTASSGKPSVAAIALGVVVLLGAVIAGVALLHHGKKTGGDALNSSNGFNLGVDIRHVNEAELAFYTAHGTFTQSLNDLVGVGFTEVSGTDASLVVGFDRDNGVCVVGNIGSSAPFALYDSEAGGLSNTQFRSQADAEASCTQQTHITAFASLAGAPTSAAIAAPAQTFTPGVPLGTEGVSGLQAQQQADVKSDLRNLATAEETYLTDFVVYTTSSSGLDKEGYKQTPASVRIVAGVRGSQDYCLAGSYDGKAPWTVYDSLGGGIHPQTYGTAAGAEKSCADHAIKRFKAIT